MDSQWTSTPMAMEFASCSILRPQSFSTVFHRTNFTSLLYPRTIATCLLHFRQFSQKTQPFLENVATFIASMLSAHFPAPTARTHLRNSLFFLKLMVSVLVQGKDADYVF